MSPGERPSSRTAKTRMIANATLEKKFDVAVQPACARRFGLPKTNRRPSFSSVHMLGLRAVDSVYLAFGGSSGLRMRRMNRPETTKLSASTSTAYGAVKIWTSTPAIPGPVDLRGRAADLELRVAVDDLVAIDERREVGLYATSKNTWQMPTRKPTDVELPRASEHPRVGDRDRREERCAREVADDEDRPPTETVDPDARRQGEDDEREEVERAEDSDLERARVEHDDRDEAEREVVDLRAELLIVSPAHSLRKSP